LFNRCLNKSKLAAKPPIANAIAIYTKGSAFPSNENAFGGITTQDAIANNT
jgi:hypothetical protein